MNNSNVTEPRPQVQYFTIRELDLVLGTLYLILGILGICSNTRVLAQFLYTRTTVKVHPFTLCALVLAGNDLLYCLLGVTPYAALILAKRPLPDTFPPFICKISGFVNNFCDRFAWFDITCIMVFRCVITVFTLKFRRISYHPFIYILTSLALIQGIVCILPFFDLDMIPKSYEYGVNFGECVYAVDANLAPEMLFLIDVLWWTPFLACIISCFLFFLFMKIHTRRVSCVRDSDKSEDAKRKTALLTVFFIISYLPKALFILFDFLTSRNTLITWSWIYEVVGNRDKALTVYVYFNMVCKHMIPAVRAAFTPTLLSLGAYLKACDIRAPGGLLSALPNNTAVSRMSALWNKFPKVETPKLHRRSDPDIGAANDKLI